MELKNEYIAKVKTNGNISQPQTGPLLFIPLCAGGGFSWILT